MKKRILLAALLCLIPVVCFAAWTWDGTLITAWNGGALSAWDGQSVTVCTPNTITIDTQPSSLALTVGGATGTVGTAHSTRTPGGLASSAATSSNGTDLQVSGGVTTGLVAGTGLYVDWNEGAGGGYCAAAQVQSSPITVSAGGAWYYPGPGSDSFTAPRGLQSPDSYWMGSVITGITGKTCTKVSFKLNATGTATACKATAAYEHDTYSYPQQTSSAVTPAVSWNDSTITSFSPTQNTTVEVECNGSVDLQTNAGYNGEWQNSTGYSNWPVTTASGTSDSGKCYAVRIWCQ
jgi:hypothetical protein